MFERQIKAGRLHRAMSFREKVWALTARIPPGRVSTYGHIARRLGTRAYRLGPYKSYLQTDVFEKLDPPTGVEDGYIVLSTNSPGAAFFAYAMLRECQIGDPVMIVAE